jgi:hypothetical protein
MNQLRIKQGATLLLTLNVADTNGAPVDLTTCVMTAQLRSGLGTLVSTPPITADGTPGEAVLLDQPSATAAYPPGILKMDISIVSSGVTTISETVLLYVEQAVTQAPS